MRAAIVCLSAVVLLSGGVARADHEGARAHFLSGLQLYGQGKYAAALEQYQAAWVTWNDPELLLDMAECNRHLGNIAEAREQYRGFLERAPHSRLRGSVERQLARLDAAEPEHAPPPAELVVPPSTAPAAFAADGRSRHAGRAARAIGIAGWATSAVAAALSIYAWHETRVLQDAAHRELQALVVSNPPPEQSAFFAQPSCSPPSTLAGSDAYRRDCNRGQQFSDAAEALVISSVALAIAGTVSYAVGARQAARARERAVEVRPLVGLSGGALQVRYTF